MTDVILPKIITIVNGIILILNVFGLIYCWKKLYSMTPFHVDFPHYSILFAIYLLGIIWNTSSAWNTIVTYMSGNKNCLPNSAAWLRYSDRWAVLVIMALLNLHTTKYISKLFHK